MYFGYSTAIDYNMQYVATVFPNGFTSFIFVVLNFNDGSLKTVQLHNHPGWTRASSLVFDRNYRLYLNIVIGNTNAY